MDLYYRTPRGENNSGLNRKIFDKRLAENYYVRDKSHFYLILRPKVRNKSHE
jgi:hypothetical protein